MSLSLKIEIRKLLEKTKGFLDVFKLEVNNLLQYLINEGVVKSFSSSFFFLSSCELIKDIT